MRTACSNELTTMGYAKNITFCPITIFVDADKQYGDCNSSCACNNNFEKLPPPYVYMPAPVGNAVEVWCSPQICVCFEKACLIWSATAEIDCHGAAAWCTTICDTNDALTKIKCASMSTAFASNNFRIRNPMAACHGQFFREYTEQLQDIVCTLSATTTMLHV